MSGGRASSWRTALAVAALVLAVVWALPLHEQLTATPRGNMSELWDFFVRQQRGRQPLSSAVSAWSDMLVGVLRPDFHVAHGLPFVESRAGWAEWPSILQLMAVAAFCADGLRRQRAFDGALGGLLLIASAVSLWSATRIEDRIFDHDVFWIVAVGMMNLAVLAAVLAAAARAAAARGAVPRSDAVTSSRSWVIAFVPRSLRRQMPGTRVRSRPISRVTCGSTASSGRSSRLIRTHGR
jgi:hypothetical protein